MSKSEISAAKHTPGPLPVKVERTCPRCHTRAYHRGNDRGVTNRIACVNCGHEWAGRIRQEEQRDPECRHPKCNCERVCSAGLKSLSARYAESEVKKAVDATYDQDYMDDYGRRAAIAKATGSDQ